MLASTATGCVVSDGNDATLRVTNHSDFTIEELYVAPVGTRTWGPNRLGGDVLFPDESLTLGVNCDFYDAKLVDETNLVCEVQDLDLCLNDADWIITNNTCDAFNAVAAQRKAERAAKAAAAVAN